MKLDDVQRRAAFDRALKAQGVAVVGASADPEKLGHQTLRSLIEGGYRGRLYPVNPRADEILGLPCFASLDAVPGDVDLAVVVVPAQAVPRVVEQAGSRGVAACVVLSGGFREGGREDLEDELLRIARQHGTLLLGPNVQGFGYVPNRLSALMYPALTIEGPLAIVGQSGTVTTALAEWAQRDGLGISALVNLGNASDVGATDVLTWLAEEPTTRATALYLEGVQDGRRLAEASSSSLIDRPLVVLKAGRSPAGRRAVASHTASLAGSDAVFSAACAQHGVTRADSVTALYDLAKGFALIRPPRGRRLLVISSSGGTGALTVDEATRLGLEPATLPADFVADLRRLGLSPRTSYANPLDIDSVEAEEFAACVKLALRHDVADTILFGFGDPVPGACETAVAALNGSPVTRLATCLGGGPVEMDEVPRLHRAGVACFPSPERAVQALSAVVRRHEWLAQKRSRKRRPGRATRRAARSADIGPIRASSSGWLTEPDAIALVEECGVSYPPHRLVVDAEIAACEARRLGYPVVLKVVSPQIVHKSDVGGVVTGLDCEAALRDAFTAIETGVRAGAPDADITGMLIAREVKTGFEAIVGARRDPDFGPVVAVGVGGVLVEVIGDVAMRLAPLTRLDARIMIDEAGLDGLLGASRGSPALDRGALEDLILRVSDLLTTRPEIAELDLNPVRVHHQGCTALDVRIRLDDHGRIGKPSPEAGQTDG